MASVAELTLLIKGKDATKGAFDSASKEAQGFSDKLEKGLKVAAVGGSAAVVGIGVAMTGVANDFQKANNTFQTDLGVTGDKAKELGEIAKTVFKDNFGENAQDAASVISQAFQQFGDVGKSELTSITENAFRMKDAFGVDTAESIDAVKTLMQNFGITSQQAFDLLTKGYQNGLNRSGDFLDTIGEYSTQFSNGGASVEQFFSLLQSGMQGGVLGTDKAADAFKEFRVRVQDGSKTTAEALASLGFNAEDFLNKLARGQMTGAEAFDKVTVALLNTENPTLKMQAGVALLGTQFEDLGQSGVDALDLTGEAFYNAQGATASLDAQYNTFGSRLEGFKRKAELALLPLTSRAAEALPIVGQLGAGLSGLGPAVSAVGPAFAMMQSTAVPALRAIGMAMLTPPLGIVIAIAAVLVAAYLFRDEIGAAFQKAWDKVEPIVKAISGGITDGFDKVLTFVRENWPEIVTLLSGPFIPLVALATDAFGIRSKLTAAWGAILGGAKTAWTNISTTVTNAVITMKNGVVTKATDIVNWFKGLPGKMVSAIGDAGRILWDTGVKIIGGLISGMASKVGDLKSFLGGVTKLIPIHKGPASTDATLLEPNGRLIIQGLISGMQAEIGNVKRLLTDLTAEIEQTGRLAGAASGPVNSFSGAFDGLRNSIQATKDAGILDAISAIGGEQAVADYNASTAALADLGNEYENLGGKIDIAQQAVDGLKSQIDAAEESLNRFSKANIAEAAPYDAASKELDRQQAQIELAINQLKQQGPLTKEVVDSKGNKKTVDTDIGKQVKALEAQLDQLRLKAQEVDLKRELEIGPLEDQIASLTDTTETIPFNDIVNGIKASKEAIATLTPEWETQNAALEVMKTRYDDIGAAMESMQTAITSAVDIAVQEFQRMNSEAAAAASAVGSAGTSIGSDLSTGIATGVADAQPDIIAAVAEITDTTQTELETGFGDAGTAGETKLKGIMDVFNGVVKASTLPQVSKQLANDSITGMNNQLVQDAPGFQNNLNTLMNGIELRVGQSPLPSYTQGMIAKAINDGTTTLTNGQTPFRTAGENIMTALHNGIAAGGQAAETKLATIVQNLLNSVNKAKGDISTAVGNITSGINISIGGARAAGGSVRADTAYLVGEKGPELWVPDSNGTVIPNHQIAAASGASINFNGPITVHNHGTQRDARGTLQDVSFMLAAGLRRRGVRLPA